MNDYKDLGILSKKPLTIYRLPISDSGKGLHSA